MHFDTTISTEIKTAIQWLQQGECVAIPTETVYGLAANALDVAAVVKIFSAKNRPTFDPLIVHIFDISRVGEYAADFPAPLKKLAAYFWPGPLTILLPKLPIIPDLVTSGLDRVALRVPAHPLALELLRALSFPLAAPSANPFGYISPTTAQHVMDQLKGVIPCIFDGGPCDVGVESTIVGCEGTQVVVYRLGGLSVEAIEAIVGPVLVQPNQSSNPAAPGMLQSHYAPRKPLFLVTEDELLMLDVTQQAGLITFGPIAVDWPKSNHIILSPMQNIDEAARNLFAALRILDQSAVEKIYAILLPESGLGRAINDRLRRAAFTAKGVN